jgi:hypothetical protein
MKDFLEDATIKKRQNKKQQKRFKITFMDSTHTKIHIVKDLLPLPLLYLYLTF